jgi:PadR family transcriptional regulator
MADTGTGGQLDLLLLALLETGPAHGYALIERLRARSGGALDVPEGSVYPALYRLERDGAIESRSAVAGGRRRRIYQLTGAGQRALDRRIDSWRTLVTAVDRVVSGGAHGPS